MYIANLKMAIAAGLLSDCEITNCGKSHWFIAHKWKSFMGKGERESVAIKRFFFHDLDALPMIEKIDRIAHIAPYVCVDDKSIRAGRFNMNTTEIESMVCICGEDDTEWTELKNIFKNLLTTV